MPLSSQVQEKVITGASAFVTGIGMGYLLNARPDLGTTLGIIISGAGFAGSIATRGMAAEALEGVGSAGLASIGAYVSQFLQPAGAGTAIPLTGRRIARAQPRALLPSAVGGLAQGVMQRQRVRIV